MLFSCSYGFKPERPLNRTGSCFYWHFWDSSSSSPFAIRGMVCHSSCCVLACRRNSGSKFCVIIFTTCAIERVFTAAKLFDAVCNRCTQKTRIKCQWQFAAVFDKVTSSVKAFNRTAINTRYARVLLVISLVCAVSRQHFSHHHWCVRRFRGCRRTLLNEIWSQLVLHYN